MATLREQAEPYIGKTIRYETSTLYYKLLSVENLKGQDLLVYAIYNKWGEFWDVGYTATMFSNFKEEPFKTKPTFESVKEQWVGKRIEFHSGWYSTLVAIDEVKGFYILKLENTKSRNGKERKFQASHPMTLDDLIDVFEKAKEYIPEPEPILPPCICGADKTYGESVAKESKLHSTWCQRG